MSVLFVQPEFSCFQLLFNILRLVQINALIEMVDASALYESKPTKVWEKVRTKGFNWSEVHFFKVISNKIYILAYHIALPSPSFESCQCP